MTEPASDPRGGVINLTTTATIPDCPRCGNPGLLSARVPNGWERSNGQHTKGTTIIVLCPACDATDPIAGAIITYFHVHGSVTSDAVQECANLITTWANGIEPSTIDTIALDSETEAWRRGELD